MAGYLTTHVLDTARGCPAAGLKIALYSVSGDAHHLLVEMVTNDDGRTDAPILEDEYQDALRFRSAPPPSLRTLDPRGLTVSVHTFSKGLFPGLRVGWVHGGPRVMQPMAAVKRFVDLETSPLMQAALCAFVQSGALDRHLELQTHELRARHSALQRTLKPLLPRGASLTDPDGGFVVVWQVAQLTMACSPR